MSTNTVSRWITSHRRPSSERRCKFALRSSIARRTSPRRRASSVGVVSPARSGSVRTRWTGARGGGRRMGGNVPAARAIRQWLESRDSGSSPCSRTARRSRPRYRLRPCTRAQNIPARGTVAKHGPEPRQTPIATRPPSTPIMPRRLAWRPCRATTIDLNARRPARHVGRPQLRRIEPDGLVELHRIIPPRPSAASPAQRTHRPPAPGLALRRCHRHP